MIIDHNHTNQNNTRGFNKWWEAGGAKFVGNYGVQNSRLSNHQAFSNAGDGIWFDWGNANNVIDSNDTRYNTGFGIQYEASFSGTIVRNTVVGNGQRGIYLPHSSFNTVAFNLIAGNGLEGITVVDEGRIDPSGKLNLRPTGNQIFGNVLAWNQKALVLPQVLADNKSDYNVFMNPTDSLEFDLGWTGPRSISMQMWTSASGQDQHSEIMLKGPNKTFTEAIKAKSAAIDLSWYLQSRASMIDVDKSLLVRGDLIPPIVTTPPTSLHPGNVPN